MKTHNPEQVIPRGEKIYQELREEGEIQITTGYIVIDTRNRIFGEGATYQEARDNCRAAVSEACPELPDFPFYAREHTPEGKPRRIRKANEERKAA